MAPRATLPLVALLVLLPGGDAASAGGSGACNLTQFSTQLDGMLSTYDREWPPASPTVVQVALEVRNAIVSETTATVRMLADLHLSWNDERLGWNASDGECHSALVSVERLWRPDVGVLSAATARQEGDVAMRARLSANGLVIWIARLDLEAPVTLDLDAWPWDQHRVIFKFGSRTHFVDEIQLTLKTTEQSKVFEFGSWEVMSVEETTSDWVRADTTTRVAEFAVTLRRRAAAHAVAATTVLVGAALLLLAAAALPPQVRAAPCAGASLTAALWLASAVARFGGASNAPRILSALGAMCAFGGFAAAAAALVVRVARVSRPAPASLRRLCTKTAPLRWFSSLQVQGGEESGVWLAAAQSLDALCFLLLYINVPLTVLVVFI